MDKLLDTQPVVEPSAIIRQATLERIRHFLQSPRDVHVYSDLRRLCTTVSVSYRNRSVLELLQNAHDAHPVGETIGRIRFVLANEGDHGTLYAANDGGGFREENFTALCSPTRTTKAVNEAIGNKGVGFLSVFQICSYPEVYSRPKPVCSADFDGFCFTFADPMNLRAFLEREDLADKTQLVAENMPQLYLATPVGTPPAVVRKLGLESYSTVMRLPLKNADARSAVEAQLTDLIAGDPDVQLFLERIAELKIDVEQETHVLERRVDTIASRDGMSLQTVTCGERAYIVARQILPEAEVRSVIDADLASETLPESWADWRGDAVISLAVTADGEPLKGRLYTFLPMGKEVRAPLAGHLDAPFFATIERKDVEEGGTFNPYLLTQCRVLSLKAAALAKRVLPDPQARHVVADLLFWTGPEAAALKEVLLADEQELIPAEPRRGSLDWTNLPLVRTWDHGGFFTAKRVAAVATFPLVDTKLGSIRVAELRRFVGNSISLAVTAEQKAEVIVEVAQDLHARNSAISDWDRFYAALPDLLPGSGARLQGRKILLTERMELIAAEEPAATDAPRNRRRLSTVFLPALRSNAMQVALPVAVQRRMTYLHPQLACVADGANPSRKFLTASNLVREFDRREVLRVISGVIADPGSAKDPDQARWEALRTILEICTVDGAALSDAAEINLRVPTRTGWHRAGEAFFAGWPGTRSDELEDLFERAGPVSAELRSLADMRLRPYSEWDVPAGKRDAWVKFLTLAGVRDHLRPIPALAGQPIRTNGSWLAGALSQRNLALSADQKKAWISRLNQQETLANPNTEFSVRDAMRLPGQADYPEIAKVAADAYSVQIVRLLEESPSVVGMTVYRPNHPHAPNTRQWPSPISAFLGFEQWVPIVGGSRRQLGGSWLPAPGETSPSQAPLVSHRTKAAIDGSDRAREVLTASGLSVFGQPSSAWPLLIQAGEWLASSTQSGDRLLSLTQDAWAKADLTRDLPAGLQLLARSDGEVVAFDPRTESRRIYVADDEDRTMVAALSRAAPGVIIFEPPLAKAHEVANYLSAQLPGRMQLTSEMEVSYRTPHEAFAFSSSDPLVENEIQGDLRTFALLTIRYKCKFVNVGPDRIVSRLSALRIRWVDELRLQFGSHEIGVPSFKHAAVLVSSLNGDTLLAPLSAKGTERELMVIASGLGEAVASRSNASDAFYAVASRMAQTGLGLNSLGLADALGLSPDDVASSMQDSRSVIGALVHVARPFVALWSGKPAVEALVDRQWNAEADMIVALDQLTDSPFSGERLIEACRTGSVEAAALELGVDLSALNRVLAELGAPYNIVDRTGHHQDGYAGFLVRQQARIRESIRATFREDFLAGDVSGYQSARNAALPTIPDGVGFTLLRSTHSDWSSWLSDWLADLGVDGLAEVPAQNALESVREQNQKALRSMAPTVRLILIKKLGQDAEAVRFWRDADGLEGKLNAMASAGGWIDFDVLDVGGLLGWLIAEGHWPKDWPTSLLLSEHGLTMDEIDELKETERKAREAIRNPPRVLNFTGGTFVVGQTSLASVTEQISALAGKNSGLLSSSASPSRGTPPTLPSGGGGGGGGGWGGGYGNSHNRMTDDEKKIVGYFGEAIAFEWLKLKFGRNRVVDHSCWKSEYRFHACGEAGNDLLGYDFEIKSGRATWFFEVKATIATDPGAFDMIELGSTEIAKAEVCKAENRSHYRILRVGDALKPDVATLRVLPNPRSEEGLKFYAEQRTGGVRLHFRGVS